MIGRYWHTLRHLRAVQIYGRLWFRIARPMPDLRPSPPLRSQSGGWVQPACRPASMTGPSNFLFLNEPGSLPEIGWDGEQREKLWRYNQHYFDDLNASEAHTRESWHRLLMQGWLRENPPGRGTAWEPYPTSLRIVNWIKWHLGGNPLSPDCVHSLAIQTRWLTKRLEWHLLGNHLFSNAKALIFSGLMFQGHEAQEWLDRGLGILRKELLEQVLPDGGHFERSTMYHALCLEDLLDLINVIRTLGDGLVEPDIMGALNSTAGRMIVWLAGMTHPDGGIAFFNDAAFGIGVEGKKLQQYAERLGVLTTDAGVSSRDKRIWHWKDSGYVRLESSEAVALIDVAPVGPDYLPGHAHADTLSFEFSLHGSRIIVNGGTSCYGASARRLRERQTVSHSTVEIDGESSSEVWGGFRVARRAYPFGLSVTTTENGAIVSCSHDGYKRLRGRPIHRREWRMSGVSLKIHDTVSGRHHVAVARYILRPGIQAQRQGARDWLLVDGSRHFLLRVETGDSLLENASYAPRFGQVVDTLCLLVRLNSGAADVTISWD